MSIQERETKKRSRPNWLTIREAAGLVGRSQSTLYRWCQGRHIPATKIRGTWIIVEEQLVEFVENRPTPTRFEK